MSNKHGMSRRRFLQSASASALAFPAVAIAGTKASGRVLGANDTIRVGVAGIHGQGSAHIDQYLEFKNVQVTHLIDPDRSLHESRSAKIRDMGGVVSPSAFKTSAVPWTIRTLTRSRSPPPTTGTPF